MSRYNKVEQLVRSLHSELEEEIKLPKLSSISEQCLLSLLERTYRFETRCAIRKSKYSEKKCLTYRGAIADLLLLIDNFDIKDVVANRILIKDKHDDIARVA